MKFNDFHEKYLLCLRNSMIFMKSSCFAVTVPIKQIKPIHIQQNAERYTKNKKNNPTGVLELRLGVWMPTLKTPVGLFFFVFLVPFSVLLYIYWFYWFYWYPLSVLSLLAPKAFDLLNVLWFLHSQDCWPSRAWWGVPGPPGLRPCQDCFFWFFWYSFSILQHLDWFHWFYWYSYTK